MTCYEILNNKDFCNYPYAKQWMQRIVFVHKSDVKNHRLTKTDISFELAREKSGRAFSYRQTDTDILGTGELVYNSNYSQFRHNVQVPFVSFENHRTLIELTRAEYFCALIDNFDNVWIFGYEFGLQVEEKLINHIFYDTLTLRSRDSGLEDGLPLKYVSNDPKGDFLNNFEGVDMLRRGEFSDDFSDDFNT